jgi:hypothetical protein
MFLDAFINANKEWAERAGSRWAAAAKEIDDGNFDAKHFVRDVFQSLFSDPVQWYLDVTRETQDIGILLNVKGLGGKKSGFIPVRDPVQTQITSLSRLGGSEEMVVGTHVLLDKPPTAREGTVVVVIQNVSTFPPGRYLGFLFEDNLPLSYVIAMR